MVYYYKRQDLFIIEGVFLWYSGYTAFVWVLPWPVIYNVVNTWGEDLSW